MKNISKRIISTILIPLITLAFVCGGVRIQGVTSEVKVAKAASDQGKYVKDIVISYASSKEKAEKELGSDYIVLDKNFNDGMSGDSWIGYSTTDDADEAIKDIKAMPMDGKYSTSDYEELLKNKKDLITDQVQIVVPAIIEFAQNYDAGMKTAQAIYRLLNVYHEDDSDQNMGDFLLKKGHALAKNRKDSKSIGDLEKIYIEGNNYVVSSIESLLTKAQDPKLTGKGSWITRMSMLGPDGLYDIYKQTYTGKSKSYINKKLDEDYGVEADALLEELPLLREKLNEAEQSEIANAKGDKAALEHIRSDLSGEDIKEVPFDADAEELIEAMYQVGENGMDAASMTSDLSSLCIINILKETPFGSGNNLYDFFMNESLKKQDLYPMVYVLSSGQKSIVESLGVCPLFESVLAEYSEKDGENLDDAELGENMFSVYEGIDRSVFDGDTAITDETLKNMETKQFKDPLAPQNSDYTTMIICCSLISATLTGLAIRSFTYRTHTNFEWYGIGEMQEQIVNTMKNNVELMRTYEYAWKVQYLEEKGFFEKGTLEKLAASKTPGRAFEEAYLNRTLDMSVEGKRASKIADRLSGYEEAKKAKFIDKYENNINKTANKLARAEKTSKVKIPRAGWGSRIAYSLGAFAALAFTGYEIYCMAKHDDINFAKIPEKMVARTYEGDVEYLAYHVVTTGSGKKADIHNKKGMGWQVLYTTTDARMGDPILTSTLSVESRNYSSDENLIPVTYFDYKYAANLAEDTYTGQDTEKTYLFFRRGSEPVEEVAEAEEEKEAEDTMEPEATPEAVSGDAADVEGSVFGGSSMIWIIILIVVAIGVGAGTGIYFRKKKKSE